MSLNINLHPFQADAVHYARSSAQLTDYTLIASPTGTGKSYMELALQRSIPGSWIITPRVEIIRGLLSKLGLHPEYMTLTGLIEAAWRANITTPIRARDSMLAGKFGQTPSLLIWDECHHHEAESWQLIDLMSGCRSVGFTATPFRGTPKSSAEFRERWGEPHWAITVRDAVDQGYLAFPHVEIRPLIDDDVIQIVNGEFQVTSLDSEIIRRLDDASSLIREFWNLDSSPGRFDTPTMISVPSKRVAQELEAVLDNADCPSAIIDQSTPFKDRVAIFDATIKCRVALIQIDVVSEGVDLPIRRLIDLRPTLSPVKWLQQLGRITRPSKTVVPQYICCNRNLLRHGYLLEGLLPASKLVEAQNAFTPSVRSTAMRAVGLEALGRFKPTTVKLKNGLECVLYNLSSIVEGVRTDYAIILHPGISQPLTARKCSIRNGVETAWGKWEEFREPLTELTGFQSASPGTLTEKQKAWWDRSSGNFGLDNTQPVDKKKFQILPILSDLRKVIR